MLTELEADDRAILFIDEIHTVIGAGATSGGSLDASNLLKPALASGGLRCIGSTTYKEYRNYFEKDRALVRRFQKIDIHEPSQDETVKILMGLKPSFEDHHQVRYTSQRDQGRGRAVDALHPRPQAARQGDRRDRRGRRGADAQARGPAAQDARCQGHRGGRRQDGAGPGQERQRPRQGGAAQPGWRPQGASCSARTGRSRRSPSAIKLVARRAARPAEADRLLPVLRPDRGRQDRGRAPARPHHGHRAGALRHVRVHGAPRRLAADRRAAGLRRLRSGRPSDRRDRPAAARRAAARRDREGASGRLQHPSAGDGLRQAHRQQRQDRRLPQRHPDHDHQRRRGRHEQARDGLRPRRRAKARTPRRSSGCSRRSSATASTRPSPSPA